MCFGHKPSSGDTRLDSCHSSLPHNTVIGFICICTKGLNANCQNCHTYTPPDKTLRDIKWVKVRKIHNEPTGVVKFISYNCLDACVHCRAAFNTFTLSRIISLLSIHKINKREDNLFIYLFYQSCCQTLSFHPLSLNLSFLCNF